MRAFKYLWLITGIACLACVIGGATHHTLTAAICALMYFSNKTVKSESSIVKHNSLSDNKQSSNSLSKGESSEEVESPLVH